MSDGSAKGEGGSGSEPGTRVAVAAAFDAYREASQRAGAALEEGRPIDEVRKLWGEALAAVRAIIDHPSLGTEPAALDLLAGELEALESDARAFFRESDLPPRDAAHRIALLRARSRVAKRLAQSVEALPPQDETPSLLVEIDEISKSLEARVGTVRAAAPRQSDDPLGEQARRALLGLNASERRVLLLRARRALAAALLISAVEAGDDSRSRTFATVRRLALCRRDLVEARARCEKDEGQEFDRVVAALADEEKRLESLFVAFCAAAKSHPEFAVIEDAILVLGSELDEVRISQPGRPTVEGVGRLRRTLADAERWLGRFRSADRGRGKVEVAGYASTEKQIRLLGRAISRFRNWTADRVLVLRLDRVFGPRMVRFWDALVFWLIIAVLALIVVDHYIDPELDEVGVVSHPDRAIFWTVWIDTAICVVLLADFFVRLALSPERWRHLRRHFVTEFIPSLPFALFANLHQGRALGLAQSIVVVRVGRFLRPILRAFRILLFMTRAADRLVDRNSWFLNRDILFFSPPSESEIVPTLVSRARDIDGWIGRGCARICGDLSFDLRVEAAEWRAVLVDAALDLELGAPQAAPRQAPGGAGKGEALDVDLVIRNLRELDDNRVAEIIGLDMARQLASTMRFFRLPVLRRLPVVRFVVGPDGALDPLWVTARLGRVAGDLLAGMQRTLEWFADLHGTITGAQFLDRVGAQLVKATARPAKRLIIFGGIAALVFFMFRTLRLTSFAFIRPVTDFLDRFVAKPIIVLGVVAAIPLLLGSWLRKIAGQAADFYDRVSEAQFLALTEILKEDEREDQLRFLTRRVFLPEVKLCRNELGPSDDEMICRLVVESGEKMGNAIGTGTGHGLTDDEWAKLQLVLLLHRDFLDGAYFHRNDTKIANMLLGNLTLENIRKHRLQLGKKQAKRLDRLDIGRGKGGMTGPYVWFNFITHAVSQKVARLVIEYNQYCIPSAEREAASETDRQAATRWIEKRRRLSEARREGAAVHRADTETRRPEGGDLVYRTTEFNALHFLSDDPRRDASVRNRYGDEVALLLREDRANLVREVFGTFPMHELPQERRVFNPYEFYGRWLARGKIFFAPFIAGWMVFRGLRILVSQLVAIVKDVLRPGLKPLRLDRGRAGFEVARRKIHRMRRPVVMEALRLRAAYDVQYLGLAWPGRRLTVEADELVSSDLRRLEASEREWEEFRELRALRERQLRALSRLLESTRGVGATWEGVILERLPGVADRVAESTRALVTAFICDHAETWSLASAYERLRDLALAPPPAKRLRGARFRTRAIRRARDRHRLLVDRCWPVLVAATRPDDAERKRLLIDAIAFGPPERAEDLRLIDREMRDGGRPLEVVLEKLLEVARRPWGWTEEILAVRTVQSLGMIDLRGYEGLIHRLGRYEDEALPDPEASSARETGSVGARSESALL